MNGEGEGHSGIDRQHVVVHPSSTESHTRIRRLFSFLQIFAFSLTFMSTWEGMCTNLWFVLYNGGPQTFAWSSIIVYVGALAQSASLAEMASIQPIAGAQYHWTYRLAPEQWKRLITWVQGWVTWLGWISLLAGVANVTAVLLQNLASLNYPSYIPERWQIVLIIWALCISQGLMNQFFFRLIPWVETVAGVLHVCFFLVFIVILTKGGQKHNADYVFTARSTSSGWNDRFVSWNVGMLTCTWSFTGFDGAVHMSEEVRKSKQAVPRALFWSIALNGVLAYAIVLAILFNMGSLEDALGSTSPIIPILLSKTGSLSATTALVSCLFVISFSVNLASVASVSRLSWARARDGGLPAWFSHINPKRHVPVRAVWLSVITVCLLALLNIPTTVAFGAIIALSSLALYFSYAIAISCMLWARFCDDKFELGGWNLGRWGSAVNVFALVFTLWIIVFLPFPSALPVTGADMNYAGPIFLFVVSLAVVLWLMWARKHWRGTNVDVIKFVVAQE